MPRVSVITPAYEAAAFIADTLRSVQEQTYGDWEAIVCDDASGDRTIEAVEAIGDERIRVVRNATNTGPAGARNTAIAAAQGELVALLDADDRYEPHYLERMVAEHDRTGAEVIACDAYLERDGARLAGTYYGRIRATGPRTLERLLAGNTVFVAALVDRTAGDDAGWFDEALFGTEDHDLWLRILERGGRISVVGEPLVRYTVADGSVSSDLGRMGQNMQRLLGSALGRGRLTSRQQRVARRQIRYYRAMELVAGRRDLLRHAPLLAGVVATNPRRWGEWTRALRGRDRAY